MSPHTTTGTASIVRYNSRLAYRADLSASTTEILYSYCNADFAKRIGRAFLNLEMDDGEQRPSAEAITGVVNLIEQVARTKSLFQPDVSAFYGEAIVTWRFGKREVTILSRGGADDPKMLKYEAQNGRPGEQTVIPNVTETQLTDAIHYSFRHPGWLYE
jgi:hypothetical protein